MLGLLTGTLPGLHPHPGMGKPSAPNGQGASNPGEPCSPRGPLSPFLPFFPSIPYKVRGAMVNLIGRLTQDFLICIAYQVTFSTFFALFTLK